MWTMDNYFIKSLVNLIGYKVVQVLGTQSNGLEEPYLGLLLKKGADERQLWFLQDEEDNGAGFFSIEPEFTGEELKGI